MLISSVAAVSGSSADTVYYVLSSLALVAAAVAAAWRILIRQRKKWTEEGEARAEQTRTIRENNTQLHQNTAAVAKLTVEMADFMNTVHSELNGLGKRVSRLEFFHSRSEKEGSSGS